MDPYEPPPRRESMLTIILTGMVTVFTVLVLILVTGGWVLWLVLVVGAMVFLYIFHYFLWGRLLDEQVAGEREEEILRQRAAEKDAEGWA